jgi:hypothetical protein
MTPSLDVTPFLYSLEDPTLFDLQPPGAKKLDKKQSNNDLKSNNIPKFSSN